MQTEPESKQNSTLNAPLQRLRVLFLQRNYGLLALDVLVDGLGGGFAGTVQAFVPLEKLDAFKAEMEAILGAGKCHILSIRPEGGAVL